MDVSIKSIIICLLDSDFNNFIGKNVVQPVPLLEFCMSDFTYENRYCKLVERNMKKNPYMAMTMEEFIEKCQDLKALIPPFTTAKIRL